MWGMDDTAGGGGGFFNEPNNVETPTQNKKDGQRRLQSVVPVFVRYIQDSKEDEFKLFGMPVQIVTIVGILKTYEVQSAKATYEIEDHSGRISAIWWLENESEPNLPVVKEGCYVRVFGSMRTHEGKKMLMLLKMFSVDNINEITTHRLEVLHARSEAEALSKGKGFISKLTANHPGQDLVNSMSFMDTDRTHQSGLTPLQEKVYNILETASNITTGMSRQALLKNFPPGQHSEVNKAIEFLIIEGHAYSTIDNDHLKTTVGF